MKTILKPLAAGFKLGVKLRGLAYRQGWLRTRRLNRPVISLGNLTVGGSGKTPLVAHVAKTLLRAGWKPAILTRGYARRRGPRLVALEPRSGRVADPRQVGDEPALLAKALPEVAIVVCADRYQAGNVAEDRFHIDVHLLDDGFQHLALARDLDIVALDTTQELSDEALLPAGRLREPISALARADAVVLTRTELAGPRSFEHLVSAINPQADLFHAATRLRGLVNLGGGETLAAEALVRKPVLAFCGLGNPAAFTADLRQWGFNVVKEFAFRDHHVYSAADLSGLMARARELDVTALVTTEKDAQNLPAPWKSSLPVFACVIETEIREARAFEEMLMSRLEAAKVKV